MTSHEFDGIRFHRRLDCLYNSFLWYQHRKNDHRPMTGGFPFKEPVIRKLFPCHETFRGLVYLHGLSLTPAWINKHIHYNVCMKLLIHSETSTVQPLGEINFPLPNFGNGYIISFPLCWLCDHLPMLRFKLNDESKRGSRGCTNNQRCTVVIRLWPNHC